MYVTIGCKPHSYFQLFSKGKEDDWLMIDVDSEGNTCIPERIDNRSGRIAHITEEVVAKEYVADGEGLS